MDVAGAATGLGRVELRGASVVARDPVRGTTSQPVTTNAHGYFQVPRLPPGAYQVCANAPGFNQGCLPGNVTIGSFTAVLAEDVRIQPVQPAIVGQVALGTKQDVPCFTDRPGFRTFVAAKVSLQDSGGATVAGPVSGNGLGQYVLPAVTVGPGSYNVVATCAGSQGHSAYSPGASVTVRNIAIKDMPPRILRVEQSVGNKPVRLANVGDTVTLSAVAEDADGDPLTFKWVDSNGAALAGNAATAQLALPGTPSSTTVFVEASDGKGGFAYSLAPVTGNPAGNTLLTGSVVDASSGAPLAAASVLVNGTRVTTGADGRFTALVAPDVRYVLSARKLGYGMVSLVTYAAASGLRLALVSTPPRPFSAGDGGRVVGEGAKKLSATLLLPANSLVDASGHAYAGPAIGYVMAYPPGTPIPGDMSATFAGRPARMETFGAVDIQLTDSAGNGLQLRPGGSAQLILDLPGATGLPSTVPMFLFDEAKGLWLEHGVFTLSGTQYRGTVRHLTAFNADLAFGTTGCIEYHVDVENSPALPFALHIEQNGQTANHEPFLVTDFAGTVARLRPAAQVDWWALPTPASSKADAIGSGSVTSTNFTSDPNDPNGDFPGVGATDQNGNPKCTKFTVTANFPNHETYLTGLPGPGSAAEEAAYSTAVDAWAGTGSRASFGDFKTTNGFPAGESSAVYFNNGDLKLGRDMHCRTASGGRIACYVSNYLDKATPPAGSAPALLAATAAHQSGNTNLLFATVAMEWDPNPPLDTSVQFFVYNGAGTRVTEATLDSEGPKSVPQICLACHGGSYDATAHLARDARFLPFDVASFRTVDDDFSAQAVTQLGLDPFTRTNQLGQFRALNALVATTETNRPGNANGVNAVLDLITGWYAGCGGVNNGACSTCVGPGCQDSFRSDYTPAGWASQPALYKDLVRVSCRGCHIMQPAFDWTDVSQFTGGFKGVIQSFVCTGAQRRMPHAEVPFKTFWQSTTAPGLLTQAPMSFPTCQR
jgi:hypothetical protein